LNAVKRVKIVARISKKEIVAKNVLVRKNNLSAIGLQRLLSSSKS
jgi:hypothetical protein